MRRHLSPRTRNRILAAVILATVGVGGSAVIAQEVSSDCTVMIGMSQVRNTYWGTDFNLNTFLHWSPGLTLGAWASWGSPGWQAPRFENENGRVSLDSTCKTPTHASFGFDPATGGLNMYEALDQVVINAKRFYPSLESIDVWLLVGGDDHAICYLSGQVVKATQLHANSYEQWQGYPTLEIEGVRVEIGPDLHVPCGSEYWRDPKGHLDEPGYLIAGQAWSDWEYDRGQSTTTTEQTTTTEATTTTLVETTTSACNS